MNGKQFGKPNPLIVYKLQVTSHQSILLKILIQSTNTPRLSFARGKKEAALATMLTPSVPAAQGK